MGLAELATIILAIAKITGYATIGWLTVFMPMICMYSLVLVLYLIYIIVLLFMSKK